MDGNFNQHSQKIAYIMLAAGSSFDNFQDDPSSFPFS